MVYTQKGQYDQAMADFHQALKIKPEDADPYYMLGVVYLKQGQHDRAIADFTKAVELAPNFAKAYCNRGVAYAMKGQIRPGPGRFE